MDKSNAVKWLSFMLQGSSSMEGSIKSARIIERLHDLMIVAVALTFLLDTDEMVASVALQFAWDVKPTVIS